MATFDGISWAQPSNSIFAVTRGISYAYLQGLWVAVGSPGGGSTNNTVAVSTDFGITWSGLGRAVFSSFGQGIAYSTQQNQFVAVGAGSSSIAYCSGNNCVSGSNWVGVTNSTAIFTVSGNGLARSGSQNLWVAVGSGTSDTLATSVDGRTWTGMGKTVFSSSGNGVAFSLEQNRWVAVGVGSANVFYCQASCFFGPSWIAGSGSTLDVSGQSVAYSHFLQFWIAVGLGSVNTMLYSSNGIFWSGLGKEMFPSGSFGVTYFFRPRGLATLVPTTLSPTTLSPTTRAPSIAPTPIRPTVVPTTRAPTAAPTTSCQLTSNASEFPVMQNKGYSCNTLGVSCGLNTIGDGLCHVTGLVNVDMYFFNSNLTSIVFPALTSVSNANDYALNFQSNGALTLVSFPELTSVIGKLYDCKKKRDSGSNDDNEQQQGGVGGVEIDARGGCNPQHAVAIGGNNRLKDIYFPKLSAPMNGLNLQVVNGSAACCIDIRSLTTANMCYHGTISFFQFNCLTSTLSNILTFASGCYSFFGSFVNSSVSCIPPTFAPTTLAPTAAPTSCQITSNASEFPVMQNKGYSCNTLGVSCGLNTIGDGLCHVTGLVNVDMYFFNSNLTSIVFPALTSISNTNDYALNFQSNGALTLVSFPELTSMNGKLYDCKKKRDSGSNDDNEQQEGGVGGVEIDARGACSLLHAVAIGGNNRLKDIYFPKLSAPMNGLNLQVVNGSAACCIDIRSLTTANMCYYGVTSFFQFNCLTSTLSNILTFASGCYSFFGSFVNSSTPCMPPTPSFPSVAPTTLSPTRVPTSMPTNRPTTRPTVAPTTLAPTAAPSNAPTPSCSLTNSSAEFLPMQALGWTCTTVGVVCQLNTIGDGLCHVTSISVSSGIYLSSSNIANVVFPALTVLLVYTDSCLYIFGCQNLTTISFPVLANMTCFGHAIYISSNLALTTISFPKATLIYGSVGCVKKRSENEPVDSSDSAGLTEVVAESDAKGPVEKQECIDYVAIVIASNNILSLISFPAVSAITSGFNIYVGYSVAACIDFGSLGVSGVNSFFQMLVYSFGHDHTLYTLQSVSLYPVNLFLVGGTITNLTFGTCTPTLSPTVFGETRSPSTLSPSRSPTSLSPTSLSPTKGPTSPTPPPISLTFNVFPSNIWSFAVTTLEVASSGIAKPDLKFSGRSETATTLYTSPSFTGGVGEILVVQVNQRSVHTISVSSSPALTWTALNAQNASGTSSRCFYSQVISTPQSFTVTVSSSSSGFWSMQILGVLGSSVLQSSSATYTNATYSNSFSVNSFFSLPNSTVIVAVSMYGGPTVGGVIYSTADHLEPSSLQANADRTARVRFFVSVPAVPLGVLTDTTEIASLQTLLGSACNSTGCCAFANVTCRPSLDGLVHVNRLTLSTALISNANITMLSFPGLVSMSVTFGSSICNYVYGSGYSPGPGSFLCIHNNSLLLSVSFPRLQSITIGGYGSAMSLGMKSNPLLVSASFSMLPACGGMLITFNPSLTSIDFSLLASGSSYAVGGVVIVSNALNSLSFPSLSFLNCDASVGPPYSSFYVALESQLVSIDVPALGSLSGCLGNIAGPGFPARPFIGIFSNYNLAFLSFASLSSASCSMCGFANNYGIVVFDNPTLTLVAFPLLSYIYASPSITIVLTSTACVDLRSLATIHTNGNSRVIKSNGSPNGTVLTNFASSEMIYTSMTKSAGSTCPMSNLLEYAFIAVGYGGNESIATCRTGCDDAASWAFVPNSSVTLNQGLCIGTSMGQNEGTPTPGPSTMAPTVGPTTTPTAGPTTLAPTARPTTLAPTARPTTLAPTEVPTTLAPTVRPTTLAPTSRPTSAPVYGLPPTPIHPQSQLFNGILGCWCCEWSPHRCRWPCPPC